MNLTDARLAVWRIKIFKATHPSYWLFTYRHWRDRPKVGYKCKVHGKDETLTVTSLYSDVDVILSDGSNQNWYHCCERVK